MSKQAAFVGRGLQPLHLTLGLRAAKEVGQGMGMSLNTAYNIITVHQGTLAAHSEVGKGSTLSIVLPLASANEQR